MKKIGVFFMAATLIFCMTCTSFGATHMQKGTERNPAIITEDAIAADADKDVTVELLKNGGTQTIIPMFSGSSQLPGTSGSKAVIGVYAAYWKVHSWKGTNITFGIGITHTANVLIRYQADVEIYDGNFLVGKLLSTKKVDIVSIGASRSLVDDVTMYTGSTKDIYIRAKNIRVQTTAGIISRPVASTDLIRP